MTKMTYQASLRVFDVDVPDTRDFGKVRMGGACVNIGMMTLPLRNPPSPNGFEVVKSPMFHEEA